MYKMLKRAWNNDVVAIFFTLWSAAVFTVAVPLLTMR